MLSKTLIKSPRERLCSLTAYQGKVSSTKVQQLAMEFLEGQKPSNIFRGTPSKIHKRVLQLVKDLDLPVFPVLQPSEKI